MINGVMKKLMRGIKMPAEAINQQHCACNDTASISNSGQHRERGERRGSHGGGGRATDSRVDIVMQVNVKLCLIMFYGSSVEWHFICGIKHSQTHTMNSAHKKSWMQMCIYLRYISFSVDSLSIGSMFSCCSSVWQSITLCADQHLETPFPRVSMFEPKVNQHFSTAAAPPEIV